MAKIEKKELETVESTETIQPASETITITKDQRQDVLKTIADLKNNSGNTADEVKKAKERYDGPLTASLKIFDGQAVVSYESYKKDSAYDWVYKNEKGEYVENHMLKITFADGSTAKVTRNAFDFNHTKSEQLQFGMRLKDGTEFKTVNQKRLVAEQDNIDVMIFDYNGQKLEVQPLYIN